MTSSSFAEYVPKEIIEQIKAREAKWEGKNYSVEDLEVIHGNTVWCLLRSGIDTPVNENERFQIKNAEEFENVDRSNKVAREWVLGGDQRTLNNSEFNYHLAGVQLKDLEDGTVNSYAYQKTSQGHKPRPGITGFTVKTLDTWGLIFEANINIKVWSRDDLDRMDLIYFKPGFPALFEWGHSLYFRPDGSIEKNPKLMVSNEKFFEGGEFKELDDLVLKARKEDYNREALFGYITNFSWSFNHDGSFDCTLKLLSKGGVITGLKNTTGSDEQEKLEKRAQDDENWWDISDYHRILKCLDDSAERETREVSYESSVVTEQNFITADSTSTNVVEPIDDPNIDSPSRFVVTLPERKKITGESGEIVSLSKALDNSTTVGLAEDKKINLQDCPVVVVPMVKYRSVKSYYLTLETLCHIINCIEGPGSTEFNIKTRSLSKFGHADTDVYRKVWREIGNERDKEYGSLSRKQKRRFLREKVKTGELSKQDKKLIRGGATFEDLSNGPKKPSYEGTVELLPMPSINPLVAIKPLQVDKQEYSLKRTDAFKLCKASYLKDEYRANDRILNIWVNFNEFVKIVENTIANSSEYKIEPIIREFLASIQKAFGNINNFDLHCDHSTECWEIVDRSHITGQEIGELPPDIGISGLKNTVIDLKVSSDISQDLVNEMCISATAPTEGTVGSENADECLVFWGENCKARWKTPRDQFVEETKINTTAVIDDWKYSIKKLYEGIRNSDVSKTGTGSNALEKYDNFLNSISDRVVNLQLDGEKIYKTQVQIDLKNKNLLHMGIIPYKMTLTMLGISGLLIGNTFKVRNGILPRKYDDWGYIITGIEHSIRNNQWFTTITTNYYPVFPNEKFESKRPLVESSSSSNINHVQVENLPDEETMEKVQNTSILYNAVKERGYTWNTYKYCARYTGMWARAYATGKSCLELPTDNLGRPQWNVGGNARDKSFRDYLRTNFGYDTVEEKQQQSPREIVNYAKTCNPGDILVYYSPADQYGHTEFYCGKGKWVSDFDQTTAWKSSANINDFKQYTMYHLRTSRPLHSDWSAILA